MTLPTRSGTLSGYSSGSGAASVVISSVPTGAWMLAVVVIGNTGTAVTLPPTWTVLVAAVTMGSRRVVVLGKIKESADTFSITKGGTLAISMGIVYGEGADAPADWQIGTGKLRATSPAETVTCTGLSITTGETDVLALSIFAEATSNEESGVPVISGTGWNGWLYVSDIVAPDTTNIEQINVAYKEMAAAGATSNATATYSNTGQASNGWGIQIGITPTPVLEPPEGLVTVWDGAEEVEATLTIWDGAEEVPVEKLLALPPDYQTYTVTQMMADLAAEETVYWAHRGGSLNWSEETMHAYTYSIFHGCRVLEFSTYITSDDVFVGMHDSTVDRTTALSGTVLSKSWADLDGVAVDAPFSDGGTVSRIEHLLETYGQTHVIVVEDKTYTHLTELLDLIETIIDDAQEHIVIKSQGIGTNAVPSIATSRGYTTWGYYYQADAPGFTNNGYYDILGMDYSASAGSWTSIMTIGKPVIGHVCPDAAAAALCLSRGAVGLQCADVLAIVPPMNDVL